MKRLIPIIQRDCLSEKARLLSDARTENAEAVNGNWWHKNRSRSWELVGGLSLIWQALFSRSSTFLTIQSAEERCSSSAASHPLCAPENRAKTLNTAACFRCLRTERTRIHFFFPFTVCVYQLIKYAREGAEHLFVIYKICRCVFDSVLSVIALVRLLVSLIFYS